MAPHSSTLAWKIPWMEEPGGLQSMESYRIGGRGALEAWARNGKSSVFKYSLPEEVMMKPSPGLNKGWRGIPSDPRKGEQTRGH